MVKIIGAGLAGVEAAYYLLKKGIKVKLYEMRPNKQTGAHQTGDFAELVCSNSLRSNDMNNAVGLLKQEMRELDSICIYAAEKSQVPAGSSLAVDRKMFSYYIEEKLKSFPNLEIIREEVTDINENEVTLIAAGPLASDSLFASIKKMLNEESLHFFDAIAPIIDFNSIDMNIAYFKSRYDKGDSDYINCPMTKEEYDSFYDALINAKTVFIKDFENNVFEGCMPVEVMAKRGYQTLLYGPLKPVGLEKNKDTKRPYAVVQLRQDDARKTMYNIVGFQTHLTFDEQRRIIKMIPGLENAKIIRYGVMHRNTYIESPKVLNAFYQVKTHPNIFFAGQISGVEGYVESAQSGIVAAVNIYRYLENKEMITFPRETIMGSMANYVSTYNKSFVPMNANFALLEELGFKHKKQERKFLYKKRSLEALSSFKEEINEY